MGQVMKLAQGRLCVPTLEQVGAAELYKTPMSYLKEVNEEYTLRRNILYKALKEMPGVVCEEPKGAFYVVVKLPVDNAEKFVIWMLKDFDVNGETVMMAPAEGFYATPDGGDEVRLGIRAEGKRPGAGYGHYESGAGSLPWPRGGSISFSLTKA